MSTECGITDIERLIADMTPVLNDGKYIFGTLLNLDAIPRAMTICEMKEKEGVTVVMTQENADSFNVSYEYVAAWITLNIHSALEAVGLTAAFSAALAEQDISCNVIAGFYHDHLFVDYEDKDRAMQALIELTKKHD